MQTQRTLRVRGLAAWIRCLGSGFFFAKEERPKHLFEVNQRGISALSIAIRNEVLIAPQNLIRSPHSLVLGLHRQNGGLAVGTEALAKSNFDLMHFSGVPVHVVCSGDQSVLHPVPGLSVGGASNQNNAVA